MTVKAEIGDAQITVNSLPAAVKTVGHFLMFVPAVLWVLNTHTHTHTHTRARLHNCFLFLFVFTFWCGLTQIFSCPIWPEESLWQTSQKEIVNPVINFLFHSSSLLRLASFFLPKRRRKDEWCWCTCLCLMAREPNLYQTIERIRGSQPVLVCNTNGRRVFLCYSKFHGSSGPIVRRRVEINSKKEALIELLLKDVRQEFVLSSNTPYAIRILGSWEKASWKVISPI